MLVAEESTLFAGDVSAEASRAAVGSILPGTAEVDVEEVKLMGLGRGPTPNTAELEFEAEVDEDALVEAAALAATA